MTRKTAMTAKAKSATGATSQTAKTTKATAPKEKAKKPIPPKNGLKIHGFAVSAKKKTLLELYKQDVVSYIQTTPQN